MDGEASRQRAATGGPAGLRSPLPWLAGGRTRLAGTPAGRHETAFHAPALEVLQTPPPLAARLLLLAILAFTVLAGVWACYGEVDQVVVAQGRLVPAQKVKVVQPFERGRVVDIAVRDGERVRQGDRLVALDDRDARAEARRVELELAAARADVSRLRAYRDFLHGTGPGAAAAADWRGRLDEDIEAHRARRAALRASLARHQAAHAGALARVEQLQALLPLLAERERAYAELLERRAVARPRWLDARERWLSAQHDLHIETQGAVQGQAALTGVREELRGLDASARAHTEAELERRQRDARSLAAALERVRLRIARSVLRAPVDGVVTALAVHTLGAVVTPAEPLLQVVPEQGALRVEAYVADEDAAHVAVGQFVMVKVDAFPFTRHGLLGGRIEHISADAVQHETLGAVFRTEAVLARQSVRLGEREARLTPGMRVTLEATTGRRSIATYLLDPVLRAGAEALRER